MAKPIRENPTIKGKAAKEFAKLFLNKSVPTSYKTIQHRKDVELFLSNKVR